MPQAKIYDTPAEKQAAYRQRKGQKAATRVQMANLAWGVCVAINNAKECGTFPLPVELVADRPEHTLKNLIRFFDPIYDPVLNPTGRFRRHREPYRIEEIDPDAQNDI